MAMTIIRSRVLSKGAKKTRVKAIIYILWKEKYLSTSEAFDLYNQPFNWKWYKMISNFFEFHVR